MQKEAFGGKGKWNKNAWKQFFCKIFQNLDYSFYKSVSLFLKNFKKPFINLCLLPSLLLSPVLFSDFWQFEATEILVFAVFNLPVFFLCIILFSVWTSLWNLAGTYRKAGAAVFYFLYACAFKKKIVLVCNRARFCAAIKGQLPPQLSATWSQTKEAGFQNKTQKIFRGRKSQLLTIKRKKKTEFQVTDGDWAGVASAELSLLKSPNNTDLFIKTSRFGLFQLYLWF